ncbi:MAG TPA: radical SAM protein [Magnetospirillum sp.]|nr:radical SAM protein [Magnetospirillum sp.]
MTQYQLDGTKINHHVEALAKWKRGETVYPLLVEISPTTSCNHKCSFCSFEYVERDQTFLDADRLISIADELAPLGTKALYYAGEGEPLLHKRLPEVIIHAGRLGAFSQALNTNGSALTAKIAEQILPELSWLRVSLNGVDAEDYAKVHATTPAQYDLVRRNIAAAAEFKRRQGLTVSIGVQCVYLGQPGEKILSLAQDVRDLGADYFALKQFNCHPRNAFNVEVSPPAELFAPLLALSRSGFQVTARMGLTTQPAPRPYKQCLALPFFAEIAGNGEVFACGPHLGEAPYSYGSIYAMDFKALWEKGNREKVEAHVRAIPDLDHECMPNCRLDAVNRYLWDLSNPPAHVDFI